MGAAVIEETVMHVDTSGIRSEVKRTVIDTVEISIPRELISKIIIDWNTVQTHGNYGALYGLMEEIKRAEHKRPVSNG